MGSFADKLSESAKQTGSIVCSGWDPAPVDFPFENISGYDSELPNPDGKYEAEKVRRKIVEYFKKYTKEMEDEEVFPGAFKPNMGYFVMYNQPSERQYPGSAALDDSIELMREAADVPIILDSKDADIARSSAAYATSKLKRDVDAMTVHPEMGSDSVGPFFDYADKNGQGVYVLTRTSNPGSKDFQGRNIKTEEGDKPLYGVVAEKLPEWYKQGDYSQGTVASVVGATSPEELKDIAETLHENTKEGEDIPLLIPGVGTQGGTAEEVMDVLNKVNYDLSQVRINSSSGIMYRAQKDGRPREEHAEASVEELTRLNREIEECAYEDFM